MSETTRAGRPSDDRIVWWDMYPLADGAMLNLFFSEASTATVQSKRGSTTCQMRPRSYRNGELVATETPRRVYLPTDDDLGVVRQCYPEIDPRLPDWIRISAELSSAGHRKSDLAAMNALEILRALAAMKVRVTATEYRPTATDLDILTAIAESRHTPVQEEIATASGHPRNIVCARLRVMTAAGVVERPNGPRKGYAVTHRGDSLLSR